MSTNTTVQTSKLANGLTVITAPMAVESVSVGYYVNAGALEEQASNNGVAHFLEHMAFKGTATRTALDISLQMENVGAYMNAFTAREMTAYHLKVLPQHLSLGVEVLSDILLNSTFPADEMERERNVIIQEINHYFETPNRHVFDLFSEAAFANQPMGWNIAGPKSNIEKMTADDLRNFMHPRYGANRMVLAAAGKIDHAQLVALGNQFSHFQAVAAAPTVPVAYTGGVKLDVRKSLEQAHVVFGWQGLTERDPNRYAASLWATALGSGMSSRLFQEVREKRGLCYSISAFHQRYEQAGVFGVYSATNGKDVPTLTDVVVAELHKATQELTEAELERAKTLREASLLMGLEDTDDMMDWHVDHYFSWGTPASVAAEVAAVRAVTLAQVRAVGPQLLATTPTIAAVGPVAEKQFKGLVK